jgi:2-polyprenyl-3-methyl-5-hydroxy-6-metoxy-1,4-benzoquinol methylase
MTLSECPVCSEVDFSKVLEVKDQLVSRETFHIVECSNCKLRFTNPRPPAEELGNYYQSEDYISHSNEANNLVDRLYKIARYFTLRSKANLIRGGEQPGRLLDIGCGTGHFIQHCSTVGWRCKGVEPDQKARDIATKESGSTVYASLEEVGENTFDRITLWHVLEHLPDLEDSMTRIKQLLKDDGKLFIAVPNYLAHEEKVFKEFWAAYDVPRHLYHFSPNAMHALMKNYGLKIDKTYPMRLDSFYISLLSNKHKNKRSNMLNSFITGLLSNIYAIKTGNYSSLIYKISKQGE